MSPIGHRYTCAVQANVSFRGKSGSRADTLNLQRMTQSEHTARIEGSYNVWPKLVGACLLQHAARAHFAHGLYDTRF
jgi:hypothetical protein